MKSTTAKTVFKPSTNSFPEAKEVEKPTALPAELAPSSTKSKPVLRIFDGPLPNLANRSSISSVEPPRDPLASLPEEELNKLLIGLDTELKELREQLEFLAQNERILEFNAPLNSNQLDHLKLRNLEDQIRKLKSENSKLMREKEDLSQKIETLDKEFSMKTYNQRLRIEESSRKIMEQMELKIALEHGNDENPQIVELKRQVRGALAKFGPQGAT